MTEDLEKRIQRSMADVNNQTSGVPADDEEGPPRKRVRGDDEDEDRPRASRSQRQEGERLEVDNLTQRKRRRRRRKKKKKNQLRRRRKRKKRKPRGRGEAVARLRLVEIGGVEVEEEVVFEEGVDNSGLLLSCHVTMSYLSITLSHLTLYSHISVSVLIGFWNEC